jgi:hypothetical protein
MERPEPNTDNRTHHETGDDDDDAAIVQYFTEHRPCAEEPFTDFNELSIDAGAARVTRQADGSLVVESMDGIDGHGVTLAQWRQRLHVNYEARIEAHATCFKATLTPRFCHPGENHVSFCMHNKWEDENYMERVHAWLLQHETTTPTPPDTKNSVVHPWHENYLPIPEDALLTGWYVPGEWVTELNERYGPLRNELLDRHRARVKALVKPPCQSSFDALPSKEKDNFYVSVMRDFLGHFREALDRDIELMSRWAKIGYQYMVARMLCLKARLTEEDESRLVARVCWSLPAPPLDSGQQKLFINVSRGTSLVLHNESLDDWSLHGPGFVGVLAQGQIIKFEHSKEGGLFSVPTATLLSVDVC